jgi:DUF971 family protein
MSAPADDPRPNHLDLDGARGLTLVWNDGVSDFLPVAFLRRHSPSADQRELRAAMARNPLTVLPSTPASAGPLRAENIELVGHYAVRIRFSDGHDTGIYTWRYLRELAAQQRASSPKA